jgi:hypothetical protein
MVLGKLLVQAVISIEREQRNFLTPSRKLVDQLFVEAYGDMKLFKKTLNKAGIPYIDDCTLNKDGIPYIDGSASERVRAFLVKNGAENVCFCASDNEKEPGVYVAFL